GPGPPCRRWTSTTPTAESGTHHRINGQGGSLRCARRGSLRELTCISFLIARLYNRQTVGRTRGVRRLRQHARSVSCPTRHAPPAPSSQVPSSKSFSAPGQN